MSYELYFRHATNARHISYGDFAAHFSRRADYTLTGGVASYEDESTGVHFEFAYGSPMDPARAPVTFRLAFCRPHVFALEAEPEVAAFVDAFDLTVSDPMAGGMGESEYSMKGFLAAYANGNRAAVRVLVDHISDKVPPTLPASRIEWCWYWNRHRRLSELARDRLMAYEHRREGVFVPKVMFLEVEDRVRSVVVWPDGIPISLPAVDLIILARDRLAPRRLGRRRADVCLLPYAEASPVLEEFPMVDAPLPHRLLAYPSPPPQVVRFFASRRRAQVELKGVSADRVLDEELLSPGGDSSALV